MGQNNDHIGQEDEDPSWTLDAGKPLRELGSHIGDYKLLSVLGEGGFGIRQRPSMTLVFFTGNRDTTTKPRAS